MGATLAQPARMPPRFMTIAEFMTYPTPEGKLELVHGELRVTPPAGSDHGVVISNLLALLIAQIAGIRSAACSATDSATS